MIAAALLFSFTPCESQHAAVVGLGEKLRAGTDANVEHEFKGNQEQQSAGQMGAHDLQPQQLSRALYPSGKMDVKRPPTLQQQQHLHC